MKIDILRFFRAVYCTYNTICFILFISIKHLAIVSAGFLVSFTSFTV